MTNVSTITPYAGVVPIRTNQTPIEFSTAVGTYLDYFDGVFTPDSTTMVDSMNELSSDMDTLAATMEGYTNYKGDYDDTVTYNINDSMTFTDDFNYVCKENGTLDMPPDTSPTRWRIVKEGMLELSDDPTPTLSGNLDGGGKSVFNSTSSVETGFVLDLSTDNVLVASLTVDSSINFTNIPAIGCVDWLLELEAGGFTITWQAAVEWDGDGTEPEWTTGTDTAYFYTTDGGTTIKGMMVRAGAE